MGKDFCRRKPYLWLLQGFLTFYTTLRTGQQCSQFINCVAAFLLFTFSLSIDIWILIVYFFNVLLCLYGLFFPKYRHRTLFKDTLDVFLFLAILAISVYFYFIGDSLASVTWEVGLHLNYVQHYASGLPLNFIDSSLRPQQLTPSNLYFFWEFFQALIARSSQSNVIESFLRARWMIPFFGFSAFFWMIKEIFVHLRTTRFVFLISFLLCLLQIPQLRPYPLISLLPQDTFRGLFLFLGSIHHSDSAMTILLPGQFAILFASLRKHKLADMAAFGAMLILAFFWHPREFFQVIWITFLLGICVTLLEGPREIFKQCKKVFFPLALTSVTMALVLYFFTSLVHPTEHLERSSELLQKSQFLNQLLQTLNEPFGIFKTQNFFEFNTHFPPDRVESGEFQSYFLLFFICLFSFIVLFQTAIRKVLPLFVLVFIVWLTTLTHIATQQFLTLATYSEILVTKIRFLFPFDLLLASTFVLILFSLFSRRSLRQQIVFWTLFSLGVTFLWQVFIHYQHVFGLILQIILFAIFIVVVFFRNKITDFKVLQHSIFLNRKDSLKLLMTLIAFVPLALFFLQNIKRPQRFQADDYTRDTNPFSISKEAIEYLEKKIPARSFIQIDPLKPILLGIYAPQYVKPLFGNVLIDNAEIAQRKFDQHPLFNSSTLRGEIDSNSIKDFLIKSHIEYIYVQEPFSTQFKRMQDSGQFRFLNLVFESPTKRDMFFKVDIK